MIDYSKYPIGAVVRLRDPSKKHMLKPISGGYIGHITGFSFNEYDNIIEITLRVTWFTGNREVIHPSNVEVL